MTLLTPHCLDSLAAAANAAPSADNRHVFGLAVDGESICVLADSALDEPPAHRRLLGLMAIGTAIENLVLRGALLGLTLAPRLAPVMEARAVVARLDVSAGEPCADDPLEAAIERRQSNRRLRYRPPGLSDDERDSLAAYTQGIEGASLIWLDAADRRRCALAMLRRAETERFRNRTLHHELFGSIRFDVGWSASADRGLPPGALGVPPTERPGFALLKHWPVQRLGNVLGLHRLIGMRAADLPCRFAPHLAAVTTIGNSDREVVRAGQALQRVWLGATARGLSCQVFAATGLYAQEAAIDVPPGLRLALREGWQSLCPGRTGWMVMRLGHAAAPPVRAGRPTADRLWAISTAEEASKFLTPPQRI